MAATMTGLPLPGYNRYNRDGEADGGGQCENGMNELAGSDDERPTSEGSVQMIVVRQWVPIRKPQSIQCHTCF